MMLHKPSLTSGHDRHFAMRTEDRSTKMQNTPVWELTLRKKQPHSS